LSPLPFSYNLYIFLVTGTELKLQSENCNFENVFFLREKSNHWSEKNSVRIFTEFQIIYIVEKRSFKKLKPMSEIHKCITGLSFFFIKGDLTFVASEFKILFLSVVLKTRYYFV